MIGHIICIDYYHRANTNLVTMWFIKRTSIEYTQTYAIGLRAKITTIEK